MSDQWVAKNSERDPNAWDVFTDEGVLIFRGMWEQHGNRAKLAAAAPELLAALKRCKPAIEMYANLNDADAAVAAIAKAEGR